MMPITPSGTRTREITRPFGRVHSAMTVPMGSSSAAISSRPRAIASTRAAAPLTSRAFASRIAPQRARISAAPARSAASFARRVASASSAAAATAARPISAMVAASELRSASVTGSPAAAQEHEVVAVDQFLAAAVAEQRLDLAAAPAGNARRLDRGIRGESARDLAAASDDADRIAAVESPADARDSRRQEALAASERRRRAGVDDQAAARLERARDPLLAEGDRRRARHEPRAALAILDGQQRRGAATARDAQAAAGGERDLRGGDLGRHAARADRGGGAGRTRGHGGGDLAHLRHELGAGVAARVGRVEAVDVREQHQTLRTRHLSDARREPVVVAVADLGGRDRVVLVDDGYRAERE